MFRVVALGYRAGMIVDHLRAHKDYEDIRFVYCNTDEDFLSGVGREKDEHIHITSMSQCREAIHEDNELMAVLVTCLGYDWGSSDASREYAAEIMSELWNYADHTYCFATIPFAPGGYRLSAFEIFNSLTDWSELSVLQEDLKEPYKIDPLEMDKGLVRFLELILSRPEKGGTFDYDEVPFGVSADSEQLLIAMNNLYAKDMPEYYKAGTFSFHESTHDLSYAYPPINKDSLQKDIVAIEAKIKALTGSHINDSDKWTTSEDKCQEVRALLEVRRDLMNKLFFPTKESMIRFNALNEYLFTLTKRLHQRLKLLTGKLPLIEDPRFDDDYEMRGTLRYSFNSEKSVLKLDSDKYYRSDFMLMIKLISDLSYDTVDEDIENISINSTPLDDGQSWNEYPFAGREEFKPIIICHAIHQLTNHQLYSIPDLFRLNDFWAEVNLTIQSITEQNGTRCSSVIPSTIIT